MKNISKGIWIGGVLVFIAGVLIFLGPIAGCRPPGWHHGSFAPPFCGRGHRFADKDFSERVLKHMDRHVEELKLTETQQQRYEALKTKLKAHLEEGKTRRVEWVNELRTELNKEKPDVQVVAAHVKKATRAFPEAMDRHVDLFVEFYGILDEGQRMKVVQRFRDRMGGPS
jgi:Spy/CpxP family protein refolding chaperone